MFVSALELDQPIEVSQLEGDGEFIVRIPCGFCSDTDYVYSLFVALSPLAGYADLPGYELIFSIIEGSLDGRHTRAIWDGNDTKTVIVEAEHRSLIRVAMKTAVFSLITAASPPLVSMTTHTAYLPDNALTKFNEICRIFADMGYQAGRADSYHGRHVWMMTR